MRLGRNDPCHCGSGRKYKRCHLDDDRRTTGAARTKLPEVAPDLVALRMSVLENQIQDLDLRVRAWTAPLHADMLTRIGAGLAERTPRWPCAHTCSGLRTPCAH